MTRASFDCPHCGHQTSLDFRTEISTQRCDHCGVRFSAVKIDRAVTRRKKVNVDPRTGKAMDDQSWTEEREEGGGWRLKMVVSLVGALVLGALVVGAVLLAKRRPVVVGADGKATTQLVGADGHTPLTPMLPKAEVPSTYKENKERFLRGEEQIRTLAGISTVDDLLPLVRNREQWEPVMREYYGAQKRGTLPIGFEEVAPLASHLYVGTLQLVIVRYFAPQHVLRSAVFVEEPDGRLLLDWPSLVAWCEVDVGEFLKNKDKTPRTMRLLGGRDDYFNNQFAPSPNLLCVRLQDRDNQHVFYGYLDKTTNGTAFDVMKNLPMKPAKDSLTVKVKFPDAPKSGNQVEIAELIGRGWVADRPLEKAEPAPVAPPPALSQPVEIK